MNYAESVRYLYSLGNEVKAAKFGLESITALLGKLGDPHRKTKFVHVAGTNGKGSTCAMIEAGLRVAGVRTGLYTSPHLLEPTERIQVGGSPISQDLFADVCTEVASQGAVTYFETVTAMAFVIFAEQADLVVLEVGLGGRLDATNVVLPELSVITPIDLDHQFFLGNTIEEIAGEKAGILKVGVPAVTAPQVPEAMGVLRRHSPLREAEEWPFRDLELSKYGSTFAAGPYQLACPLAGAHQVENARTAAMALDSLGVNPVGIAGARWPGRLQRIARPGAGDLIVDGAHNPAGARALAAYVKEFFAGERLTLIFGAMRDKAVAEMAAILFPLFADVIVTAVQQDRAMPAAEIAALARDAKVRVSTGLDQALSMAGGATTFISGSLFLVAEALSPDRIAPGRGAL
jgi:dihydrofolate synthase/folylpolyglutamate synthase